jgi:hypothetical protein
VVTLSIVNHHASLSVACRLYLPRAWADDAARRKKAHVPAAISFETKQQTTLGQTRTALLAGIAPGVVPMMRGMGTTASCAPGVGTLRQSQAMMPRRTPGHLLIGVFAPEALYRSDPRHRQRRFNPADRSLHGICAIACPSARGSDAP